MCVNGYLLTSPQGKDNVVRLRHIGKMRVKTGAGVTGIEPTRGLESGIRLSYIYVMHTRCNNKLVVYLEFPISQFALDTDDTKLGKEKLVFGGIRATFVGWDFFF